MKAAEATHCAGEQSKYWEMHDRLFGNQQQLARPDLSKHAQALGLDVAAFDQCVDTGKSSARIRKDMAEAQELQVKGTPTFFLGLTDPNGSQVKGTGMVGARSEGTRTPCGKVPATSSPPRTPSPAASGSDQ